MAFITNQWIKGEKAWHPVRCSVDVSNYYGKFGKEYELKKNILFSKTLSIYKCTNEDCLHKTEITLEEQNPGGAIVSSCDNCSSNLEYQGTKVGDFNKVMLEQHELRYICLMFLDETLEEISDDSDLLDIFLDKLENASANLKLSILKKLLSEKK